MFQQGNANRLTFILEHFQEFESVLCLLLFCIQNKIQKKLVVEASHTTEKNQTCRTKLFVQSFVIPVN